MINIEKQIASTSVDEDLLNISTLIDSDHELEDEDEAEINRKQQAKKIVEVDNVIVEKEEILKKLLDTVRGYSAMKVCKGLCFVRNMCMCMGIFICKYVVPLLLPQTNFFKFFLVFQTCSKSFSIRNIFNFPSIEFKIFLYFPYSIHFSLHMYLSVYLCMYLFHLTYTT